MRDTPRANNIADFQQRYGGTFGWLVNPTTNKKLLVSIISVDRNGVRFKDASGQEGHAYLDTGVMFEFLPVEQGWFNTDKTSYFMTRRPARQWHRGISHDNTAIFAEKKNGLWSVNVSIDVLDDIFNRNIPIADCVRDLRENKRSAAGISKDFAILGKELYFYSKPIAKYEDGKILLETPIIAQEIKDAIKYNNLPLEVVINA
jgi:hypothetical protein